MVLYMETSIHKMIEWLLKVLYNSQCYITNHESFNQFMIKLTMITIMMCACQYININTYIIK